MCYSADSDLMQQHQRKTSMSLRELQLEELIKIASAGGGFSLSTVATPFDDLVKLALASAAGRAQLVFFVSNGLSAEQLAQIALAGQGTVKFEVFGGGAFAIAR
jgi:hypothetical protein